MKILLARFSFGRPLVRVIYFVLTGVFIVLCFTDVLLWRNNKRILEYLEMHDLERPTFHVT